MRIKLINYCASKTSRLRLIIGVSCFPALDGLICGFTMIVTLITKVFLMLAINIIVHKELIIILLSQKVFLQDSFIFKFRILKFFKLYIDFIIFYFYSKVIYIYIYS